MNQRKASFSKNRARPPRRCSELTVMSINAIERPIAAEQPGDMPRKVAVATGGPPQRDFRWNRVSSNSPNTQRFPPRLRGRIDRYLDIHLPADLYLTAVDAGISPVKLAPHKDRPFGLPIAARLERVLGNRVGIEYTGQIGAAVQADVEWVHRPNAAAQQRLGAAFG